MPAMRRTARDTTRLSVTRDPSTGYTAPTSFTFGPVEFTSGPTVQNPPPIGDFSGQPDLNLGGQVAPSLGSLLEQGGVALCKQFFSESACMAAAGLVTDLVGGGGGPGTGGAGTGLTNCPAGTIMNPKNGVCEAVGSPGDVSTPGGGPTYSGDLPPGAAAAYSVGRINGHPIYRCPKKFVLADPALFGEGVCFHKNVLPNKLRKWPKAPRAKISAHDWKMMRRYGPGGSKQKRVKEIASAAGFSCKKR